MTRTSEAAQAAERTAPTDGAVRPASGRRAAETPAVDDRRRTGRRSARRAGEPAFGIVLTIGGLIGLAASFSLMVDEIKTLQNPSYMPLCNWSLLIECSKNLHSAAGSIFGFPNPILGLVGFTAVLATGVVVLCGARLPRWYWLAFQVGILGALGLVVFMLRFSIYVSGTLCPWCMSVWVAVIVLVLTATFRNLAAGVVVRSSAVMAVGRRLFEWTPLISLLCLLGLAVLAQLRLDVIGHLFR